MQMFVFQIMYFCSNCVLKKKFSNVKQAQTDLFKKVQMTSHFNRCLQKQSLHENKVSSIQKPYKQVPYKSIFCVPIWQPHKDD